MGYTPDFIEVAIIPLIKEIKQQGNKTHTQKLLEINKIKYFRKEEQKMDERELNGRFIKKW